MKDKQDNRKWVKIIAKENGNLVGYYYNPYNRPTKEIVEMFIPKENLNKVRAYKVN